MSGDGISYMERHHVVVEVCKVNSTKYFRRTYEVEAPSRAEAEKKALFIAKEEWFDANLPPKEVF